MLDKSGYLYFYADKGEYSTILHLSILCASIVLKKVYLCVSKDYYSFFLNRCSLPANVELICIEQSDLDSPLLNQLDELYSSGIIRSNCPPVERHCINRWLLLEKNSLFGEDSIINFDWDTMIFPGLAMYQSYISKVDLAATNLFTLGWHTPPKEPIWSLCPNLLLLSQKALHLYIIYLEKYLDFSGSKGSVVADLFCDMQPWSSVISTALVHKTDLRLYNFNDTASHLPLVDHNLRVTHDCGLDFKPMRYYFQPGSPTYLDTPFLKAKQIVFSQKHRPFFVLENQDSEAASSTPPCLQEAAAIHFSGVEGKHLLTQTYIEDVSHYLAANLHEKHLRIQ